MNLEFVFRYPLWFSLLCLLAGFLYAWLLYRKDTIFLDAPNWVRWALPAFRGILVSMLTFLLMAPLLKFVSRQEEPPLLIFLQDNSASLASSDASKPEYARQIEQLRNELKNKYELRSYTFSETLNDSFKLNFRGRETDIAEAIEQISNLYENRNMGAIILASDGIYNKGISPLYARNKIKAPLFTIALGDTIVKHDLLINKINHNQLAYLNNKFPVEVVVQANKLKGKHSRLGIYQGENLLASKDIDISQGKFLETCSFELKAEKVGVQRYSARLEPVDGDAVPGNNQMDFFIEVLDSRQKILILAEAPDPDIGAIRMSLRDNPNYEVEASLADQFQGSLKPYSLIILHQIPGRTQSGQRILAEAEKANIPILFIVGMASSIGQLNAVQHLVQYEGGRGSMNETQATLNKDFGLFTLSDDLRKALKTYDPLQTPYASYKVSQAATIMLRQKIGTVETEYPLFVFQAQGDRKTALLLGTGIWRWRMHDFAENQNHNNFNELLSKTVQYLCARNDQRYFRLMAAKSFNENEDVILEAEVYNASYELVNEPDVIINIFDAQNRSYPFSFSRAGNAYKLNAGQFPAGDYHYEAKVNIAGKEHKVSGQFIIKPVVVELMQTTADHGLLRTLAEQNGGKMVYPADLQKLPEMIQAMADLKPVSHSEVKLEDLISLPWLFFILLFLLSLEWGIRKWQGSY